jgi:putative hemolysin
MHIVYPEAIVNSPVYKLNRLRNRNLSVNLSDFRFRVKLAEHPKEIDAALKLRFDVFNLEMNTGLPESYAKRRDEDEFDKQCHHLIAIEKSTGEVVGTYRLQTFEMAKSGKGFYASSEFDLRKLGWFRLMRSVELGRACIKKEFRNGRVLFLLWKGISEYMQMNLKRYLFGCCSLASQETIEGTLLMNKLIKDGNVLKSVRVNPKEKYECYIPFITDMDSDIDPPHLMETYFRYGAKVCSFPAIDRHFKTIDYLMLLDMNNLPKEMRNVFDH